MGVFMDWSENIKKLRAKMLITQTELAELLGVSYISINRYENNQHQPTMKIKRKLMQLFIENNIVQGDSLNEK